MSEVSNISVDIIARGQTARRPTTLASRDGTEDATPTRLEYETDPSRMDYVKAFRPEALVELLVRAKGIDVVAINVRDQCTWTDHLIITTAPSKQHLRALATSRVARRQGANGVRRRWSTPAGRRGQGKRHATRRALAVNAGRAWCTCSLPMVARGTISRRSSGRPGTRSCTTPPRAFDDRYHRASRDEAG